MPAMDIASSANRIRFHIYSAQIPSRPSARPSRRLSTRNPIESAFLRAESNRIESSLENQCGTFHRLSRCAFSMEFRWLIMPYALGSYNIVYIE